MPVCTPVDAYETTLCATGRFRRPAHMITHARPSKEPVEYELDTDDEEWLVGFNAELAAQADPALAEQVPPLKHDSLEAHMDVLEKASFAVLHAARPEDKDKDARREGGAEAHPNLSRTRTRSPSRSMIDGKCARPNTCRCPYNQRLTRQLITHLGVG